jgi:hypothetical protein
MKPQHRKRDAVEQHRPPEGPAVVIMEQPDDDVSEFNQGIQQNPADNVYYLTSD